MTNHRLHLRIAALVILAAVVGGCASTKTNSSSYDEARKARIEQIQAGRFDGGRMWTFEYPPLDYFQETYGFRPDQAWLDDVRQSSLKYATWCSASFVSADGLVMTNHHCARSNVVAVQREGEKLLETGFYAPTLADERRVPDLFVEQLIEIRDVTAKVHGAMDAAGTDEEKIAARGRVTDEIQKAAEAETKLRAQVVSLYNGGKYSLYLFKRYTDVRLVFAPELSIGHYGGEWDNFTYPRYSLDCSFVRVYDENGEPLKPKHYYKWSAAGAKEGEPVFVIGNPGSTSRLNTAVQLEYNRDVAYPYTARVLNDRAEVLHTYAEQNPAKREDMVTQILGIANSQKAYNGRLAGLRDDELMQRRKSFDTQFRAAVEAKPELKNKYGHIWDEIAESRARLRAVAPDMMGLRMMGIGAASSMSAAYRLIAYHEEMAKPEGERARQYQGRGAEAAKRAMERFVAIDAGMEVLTLTKQLALMRDYLGANDPIVTFALRGETPEQAARRLVAATVLKDSVVYAKLAGGGEALAQSQDPILAIVRMAKPRIDKANAVQMEVSARDQVNATLLGRAQYDVYGTSIPPDATFTMRLADGVVKGFEYNGTKAAGVTTFYGMYDRHYSNPGDESWALPERWINHPADFDLSTPYNLASTNDIIGGNSGSPIVNKNKEVVGLVFDGNIESLPGDFIFAEDKGNRTVSVHSAGIIEALRAIYKAQRVVDELKAGKITTR
jgi:hypothetical protein